jgi:hypothetical protein
VFFFILPAVFYLCETGLSHKGKEKGEYSVAEKNILLSVLLCAGLEL